MRMHMSRTSAVTAVLAGSLALWACDLGVTNPAVIEESDLFVPGAVPSIVNGARYTFNNAISQTGAGGVFSVSAALTDELTHVGTWVPPREISDGVPGFESPENQSHWGQSSRARWQAEDAIGKLNQILGDEANSNEWMALAKLYAGFSNRLLGDMFCEAVIDGGELLPHTAFFTRGEGHFAEAIQVAGTAGVESLRLAAYAGRAQVRMMLGDWTGAVADAALVPTGFRYMHIMSDNSGSEANGVFEWGALAAGQYSVWATPFAEWGLDVTGTLETEGDPRASFMYRDVVTGHPQRPFYFLQKYTSRNDDVALAKGTEMRLIEAEALLRGGNVAGAVAAMNLVRAHHGLDDVSAANAAEAWELLMKERGLELWLEGRRLPDLRRWAADADTRARINTTALRGEEQQPVYQATPFCLRISSNEIFSNPNLTNNPPT